MCIGVASEDLFKPEDIARVDKVLSTIITVTYFFAMSTRGCPGPSLRARML